MWEYSDSDSEEFYHDYRIEVYYRKVWVIQDDWFHLAHEGSFEYRDLETGDSVCIEFIEADGKYALRKWFEWSDIEFDRCILLKRLSGGWDSSMAELAQANGFPEIELEEQVFRDHLKTAIYGWQTNSGWSREEWNRVKGQKSHFTKKKYTNGK